MADAHRRFLEPYLSTPTYTPSPTPPSAPAHVVAATTEVESLFIFRPTPRKVLKGLGLRRHGPGGLPAHLDQEHLWGNQWGQFVAAGLVPVVLLIFSAGTTVLSIPGHDLVCPSPMAILMPQSTPHATGSGSAHFRQSTAHRVFVSPSFF